MFNKYMNYKIELYYTDIKTSNVKRIEQQNIKYLTIHHNYEINNMPVLFLSLSIDKSLIDHMVLNINKNLLTMALYKYNEIDEAEAETECFRKQFTYFLPKKANANAEIDYTEDNENETVGNTLRNVIIGLMCVDHINNNKRPMELNMKNVSMFDCVRHCMSHFNNLVMEPFNYNKIYKQLIIPPKNSISKVLSYLNNLDTFYTTPFRYYQDFKYTYLISTSNKVTKTKEDIITNVLLTINKSSEVQTYNDNSFGVDLQRNIYTIDVNYANMSLYNNDIINKSKITVKGISNSGTDSKELNSKSDYMNKTTSSIRLNNDNDTMLENIVSDYNSSNLFITINKSGLDSDIFTLNKKYIVKNIDKYRNYDGEYILSEKIDAYTINGDKFKLDSILKLRKFE